MGYHCLLRIIPVLTLKFLTPLLNSNNQLLFSIGPEILKGQDLGSNPNSDMCFMFIFGDFSVYPSRFSFIRCDSLNQMSET